MNLHVEHKEINQIKHAVKIEFPWTEVDKRVSEVITDFRMKSEIPGFRQGKAPDSIVRAHIGEKKILKRAAEKAAHDALSECVKTLEQKPIFITAINLDDVQKGEPISFVAKYYIEPPDPQMIEKKSQDKSEQKMKTPEDVFPTGPPGIQSHGPYGVSIEALKTIPGVDFGDKFIPKTEPSVPKSQVSLSNTAGQKQEIPDPEKLITPPKVLPATPKAKDDKENTDKSTEENSL